MGAPPRPTTVPMSLIAVLCWFTTAMSQSVPIQVVVQCEDFSARQGGYFPVPPPLNRPAGVEDVSGNFVQSLGSNCWLRYDSVNFAAGEFDSVTFRYAGWGGHDWDVGHRVRLRLDSLDGTEIASFDLIAYWYQNPPLVFPLSRKLTGRRTLYMTFEGGDTICRQANWLRFSGRATVNSSEARTYYVAPYGSDGNDGLSVGTAFKTIQKAATVMKPGSICNIRQGIYRETVCPWYTGTAGAPLTFQAYNSELVYIDGADSVTGWTPHTGSIYKSTMPWSLGRYKNQLMVDGKTCVVARSPNIDDPSTPNPPWVGVYPYGLYNWVDRQNELHPFMIPTMVYTWGATTADQESQGLYSWNITQYINERNIPTYMLNRPADYYKGGLLSLHNMWWPMIGEIRSSTPAPSDVAGFGITVPARGINAGGFKSSGTGYISYLLALLDSPNEWFRDSVTGRVYLWAPDGGDPSHHLVEGKRRLAGFDLTNKQYVTLKGLHFIATSATLADAWHCTIDNCHWKYPSYYDAYEWWEEFAGERWSGSPYDPSDGFSGVFIGGGYNTVKNSSSTISAGSGFIAGGRGHHSITNCIIHDCNWLPTYNAGIRQYKRDQSIIEDAGGNLFDYNTIYSCGRATIELDFGYGARFPPVDERTRILHNDLGACGWLANEVTSVGAHAVGSVEIGYNRFHSTGGGTGYIGSDPTFGGYGFKVHHNVFFKGRPVGTGVDARALVNMAFGMGDDSLRVFNNTCVETVSQPLSEDAWPWDTTLYHPGQWVNNIFGKSDTAKWKYTDAAHDDYTLRAGSPAIDSGVLVPGWVTSADVVGKPDLGAYEFGKPAWTAGANWRESAWVYPPPPVTTTTLNGSLTRRGLGMPRLLVGRRLLIVSAPRESGCRLMLYDMQGALVLSQVVGKGGTAIIPTQRVANGVYVLRAAVGRTHLAQWKVCLKGQ